MLLDKQALNEFQTLYLKEFQIRITEAEANDYGNRLTSLVKAVCGNDPFELKAIDRLYGKEKN